MNKYQKVKMIGEGSFGKAFLVRDRGTNKQYVIKEINMGKMGAKEREDARKEVAVLAQLQHPNIVSYKESFEEMGNLFISMDFCESGDLFARINAQRGILMQETQVLDMFVQICLAIKHIHDRKILHRDIKSQNIFITKGGIMKVGDFGIAKVMNSTMELARTCIGTPYYLSPEICENRPYNNKSDIWSLGCVLYEMTTLKHPFEAGSMKNLVLKIIRGTYPPVPPRYSYELRNLLSQLFKRNPRDRPSINAVLKKPFIQNRIKRFLSENEVQSEFSHTVLHGERLHKRLPPGGRPVSAPVAKKPTPAPTPSAQRYDPSSIYKNKIAARRPASAANRAAPVSRQNSGGGAYKPPQSAAAQRNNDLVARRRELLERERKRRAEVAVKKSNDAKSQHQKFMEKQKQDRINKGKEQWRNNLLDSYGDKNDGSDKQSPRDPPSKPAWVDPVVPAPAEAPRGNYARYHEALDKQKREREERLRQLPIGGGDAPEMDPISAARRAAAAADENRGKGAESAERARVIQDFRERQRQAMLNKARGQGFNPQSRPPSGRDVNSRPPSGRNVEEDDYLQKLKQIRLQNFNERRVLQDKKAGRLDMKEAERLRNEKIEALKVQAEERGRQLKAQMEKHRQEALAKEQQRAVPAARPSSALVPSKEREPSRAVLARPSSAVSGGRAVPVKATPMPGLTNALNAIGAENNKPAMPDQKPASKVPSMTNVMVDIGVEQPPPAQQAIAGRQKWGAPVATPPSAADNKADRGKWSEPSDTNKIYLSNLELESTASQMEATAAQPPKRAGWGKPTVLKPLPENKGDNRPAWGSPSGTVVNALQSAAVIDSTTVTISPQQAQAATKLANEKLAADNAEANQMPVKDSQVSNQKIGETISVSKPLLLKKPVNLSADGSTITLSKDQPDTVKTDNGDLADTSVPLFNKLPKPFAIENKMAADSDLDVADLDETEKKLIGSLERAKQPFMQKTSGLMIGITVGNFDCNTKMLRTCSEPDLAKLFRTMDNPFIGVTASATYADGSDSEEDNDEVDGEERMSLDDDDIRGQGSAADSEEGDGMDTDEDEDTTLYEAELAALMTRQGSSSTQESDSRLDVEIATASDMDEDKDAPDGGTDDDDDDFTKQDAADFKQMKETLQQLLTDGKDKATNHKTLNATLNHQTLSEAVKSVQMGVSNISVADVNKEEWMSDSSSDSDRSSANDEEEDKFCRLEESRANLEQELGEATFMQAYKIIQATQEDEEEDIDEGRKLVTKVLGDEKSHLYDKILHLVVSDSAYLDGN